ncbi:MAG: hypothetical protein HPY50_01215 [Firmicutes bacterium]|nr:hypothetical protein [Bacillota bacterium]
MVNSLWLYRFFDIAEEIDLAKVEEILSQTRTASRVRLTRFSCRSVQFRDPPVTVDLGGTRIRLKDGTTVLGSFSGKIYDLGVIGIALKVELGDRSFEEIKRLGIVLTAEGECLNDSGIVSVETPGQGSDEASRTGDELEDAFLNQKRSVCQLLGPALTKPSGQDFMEDYTLYFFTSWDESWDPAPLLLAEDEPLSQQSRNDTLRHSLSYGPEDLTIITWDAALVYDATGGSDIPDLLEFAVVELLELRYYDRLLDKEMEKMYKEIEAVGYGFGRLSKYRRLMKRLMELVLDITEVTERIHNSLKVTGDVFYARVYGTALTAFRTRAWMESVERKVALIQQNYSLLSGEVINQRSMMLEWAIVILISVEIILGLLRLL